MAEPNYCCDLFYFYIKPQLLSPEVLPVLCCDLFYFYIKPQLEVITPEVCYVVTYSISTSNHNRLGKFDELDEVVTYSISTSNHN